MSDHYVCKRCGARWIYEECAPDCPDRQEEEAARDAREKERKEKEKTDGN